MDEAGFDTTVVRETIEQQEPIKALDLNYQLFSQGYQCACNCYR